MKQVGAIIRDRTMQDIVRHGGLIASLAIALYVSQVTLMSGSDSLSSLLTGYLLAIGWTLFGALQFYTFSSRPVSFAARTIGFHILGALTILLVTGYASASVLPYWVLLALGSHAHFRLYGMAGSLATLWLLAFADSTLNEEELFSNLSTALAISIISLALIFLSRARERDEKTYAASKTVAKLQQESMETLVNNIADAVLSTDEAGIIRVYNAAAIGLIDTNTSLIGAQVDDILKLHTDGKKRVKLTKLLQKSRAVVTDDSLRTTLGDEEIRLDITYSPIRAAYSQDDATGKQGYIVILRDITKAKSLEEERDEFISVVSHELRTPITIAEGAIDNARLVFEKDPSKQDIVAKSLVMAHNQTLFLSRMINDLSTLSRAERGVGDDTEDIDVRELTRALRDEYSLQAKEKNLGFHLEEIGTSGILHTSRLYLHELLQNFITNAIKYTKEGDVTLRVEATKTSVTFSVKDSGIGISKADQKKIFEKFYRSEDYRTRETGGTGLGLYVSNKLARKLGTTITLESRLNHGSRFSFSLKKPS